MPDINICDIVDGLRDKYRVDDGIDWYAMAGDENITLYEPAPLSVPAYVRRRRENDVKRFIFAPRFLFSDVRNFALGHEYGHHFLKHLEERLYLSLDEKEVEADCFAMRLTGIENVSDKKMLCECLIWIFMHPLRSWRAGMGDDSVDIERCIRDAESQS